MLGKRQRLGAHFNLDTVYTLRASKKLRAFISHEDGRFRIEAFAHRGEKAYYSRER